MKKRLISYIPYRHVTISTNLTLDEIVNLFSSSISPKWDPIWHSPPRNIKKCQGEVSDDGFSIRPTDYYRGSLTYLIGKFTSTPNGVKIDMYLTGPLYFVLPLFGCAALCFLLGGIASQNYIVIFFALVVLVGGSIGFFIEADRLDWFIGNLLEKYLG